MIDPVRAGSPFDPDNEAGYRRWREAKLARAPADVSALTVEVRDPGALTDAEHRAMLACCRDANMVVYASARFDADKDIPRRLGARFGLLRLDRNWLADDDGVSQVTVVETAGRGEFIPYTNRPIRWHTDGYYNPPGREIRAMLLHCVSRAGEGGTNRLLDHELAYLMLRDADPAHVHALMLPDAMTIPARLDDDRVARPAQTGPVFSVDPGNGALHMRYTARTRSIEWKRDPAVQAAVAALERLLAAESPHIQRVTLAPGMGILCNNVLHDRTGFVDDPDRPRLLYRARYQDRIAGT
ncbi:MAG TPA: TauD/TfdA family dioxygenase [Casimicrobiaceae bacterium]|nr:TauD/TfdA family dioxygenase [Casimicrobiaceae bacterium]